MAKILIIEDEVELVRVLRSYLEQAGFSVLEAHRGDNGLSMWKDKNPDLVILDLNLPGLDGLDVARAIRQKSDTPILILTARIDETDQLIGLELGADDYILKPFSPKVLVARVRTLLRRTSATLKQPQVFRIADIEIDLEGHQVTQAGRSLDLTKTEFILLTTMASQPGRVFTRLQLLEKIQGVAYEGYERTIDAHIKNLRGKIDPGVKNHYIETVFGVGYKFTKSRS